MNDRRGAEWKAYLDREAAKRRREEQHRMRGKVCPIQRPMFDKLF